MIAECYLRVGRKRGGSRYGASDFVFDVGVKEPTTPLYDKGRPLHTAVLKLNLELPRNAFGPTAVVDITVPPEAIRCVVTGEAV